MKYKFWLWVALLLLVLAAVVYFRFSPAGVNYFENMSRGGQWLLPVVLVAAILDSINPCAFSVLLLTIAFLFSLGKLRGDIFRIGGFYILGLFTIYTLIGLGILQALSFFGIPHFMARLAAALLVGLGGLNLVNHFFPAFPIRLGIPRSAHTAMARLMERSSGGAAFVLGGFVGLCEFPCTGGPYLLVLGLLHDSGTYLTGLAYLAFYNFVFVLPLIIILGIASHEALLNRVQEWKKRETGTMRLWGGLAMIVLGLLIFIL